MSRLSGVKAIGEVVSSLIVQLIYLLLLILKQTGELIFGTIVYLFSTILATYNLIFYLISQIFLFPWKIITSTLPSIARFLSRLNRDRNDNRKKNWAWDDRRGRRIFRRKLKLFIIELKFFFLGAVVIILFFLYLSAYTFIHTLPNPKQIMAQGFPATTKIYDRNGILLYEIYESYNRVPVKLAGIPKSVISATIASEDKEFYLHNGVSIRGIARAILHNLQSDALEGGSTITQQLIRSTYLTPEKTYIRKTKEIILAIWIEKIYTKDQILSMYLNQVPYGGTAWGIEAAAQTYFGKKTSDLTIGEAAFLAGLPAAPSKYSPFANPEINSESRKTEVLKRMLGEKLITDEEFDLAINEKLRIATPRTPIAAPHFVMYTREILNKYYGRRQTESGGLRVVTTLDLRLQEYAERSVAAEIEKLKPLQVTNGAALVTNPKNGEIYAMVGSADYFDLDRDGNVNVTSSERSPGSSIKVVNYAVALQNGYTAASIINDSPVSYEVPGQAAYRPVNYDGKTHGAVTLRTALGSSYNIPAVKVLNTVGIDKMIDLGKKMGIDSWRDRDKYGLSLTLGGGSVAMTDMAEVYGTLANNGKRHNLTPLISVTDQNGKVLPTNNKSSVQVIPETVAFILSDILSDNEARRPAFGNSSALNIPGKNVSVKTGTSDNKRDNWTIGYTPDFVTTVWVGNNDNSVMNRQLTSGVTGAAPIWRSIMEYILKNYEVRKVEVPTGIISIKCGKRPEYFIEGTITNNPCKKADLKPTETASE